MRLFMKKILLSMTLAAVLASSIFAQTAAPKPQTKGTSSYTSSYKLRPMDVLSFSIFQEPDMSAQIRISADGFVTLPLIERVSLEGLTLGQARERITELYKKDYFVNPQVSLFIDAYSKQSCYVTGWVNGPREYEFPIEEADSMTITKVIAGCGGFNPRANRRAVIVKRKFADGKEQIYTINVRNIMRDPEAADFPIVNGDIIEVPEDII